MDAYGRGFRDGASEACQAQAERLDDAISVLREFPAETTYYSRDKVIELLQLLARKNQGLAAQIAAVGATREGDDDGNGDEGEASQ